MQTLGSGLAKRCRTSRSRHISLHIHAHSSTLTPGTTKTEDDTRAISEGDNLALILRHRVVDRVFVLEIVQTRDGEAGRGGLVGVHGIVEGLALKRLIEVGNEGLGTLGRDFFIVVSTEEGAAIDGVELVQDVVDADNRPGYVLISSGEDIQPG